MWQKTLTHFFGRRKWVGKQINGYLLETYLGRGRYGVCFKAKDVESRTVLVKKLKKPRNETEMSKQSRYFEAVILSNLNDQRIPEFLGVINEAGFYAYVLEFKAGKTLKQLLFEDGYKFTAEEIRNIGVQLISIMKLLHTHQIVHRDISISNVVFNEGEVSLIDFGLARWSNNQEITCDLDYSYFGDLLLYLLYSSFTSEVPSKRAWYEELPINAQQILFIKRLLLLEFPYQNIDEIAQCFNEIF